MLFEYNTIEEARQKFKWGDKWKVFDKDRNNLNIAYECVDRHPKENTAIRIINSGGSLESYRFGDLSRWTSQFANFLSKKGIKSGDRVAVVLNPSIEYYIAFFGTLKAGVVVVPCYPLLGSDGVMYRVESSKSKLIIISKERAGIIPDNTEIERVLSENLIDEISDEPTDYEIDTSADTLAVIQFTSGTTGLPKQTLYHHMAMTITAIFVKVWIGLKADDIFLCTSSPAWGHGVWYGTVGPMIYGNGIGAYSGKFDPAVLLKGMESFRTTVASFIPRVFKMIMISGQIDNFNLKLKRVSYAGDSIDNEVVQYFQNKIGLSPASCYGNTESGPIVLDYAFNGWEHKPSSAGVPFIGTKIGILDDNGNEVQRGITGQVAVWRNNKWNPIGDYGYLDDNEFFFPKGRSDDVIKSSGYRIGPFEIEIALENHSTVQKAAVVGSPDEERGEIVKAFVVTNENVEKTSELIDDLKSFVKSHLSMHEYPREIEFVESLPETPDGKLQRKKLKKMEYDRKQVVLI